MGFLQIGSNEIILPLITEFLGILHYLAVKKSSTVIQITKSVPIMLLMLISHVDLLRNRLVFYNIIHAVSL